MKKEAIVWVFGGERGVDVQNIIALDVYSNNYL